MGIFGRKELSPYNVTDKVTFRNVDKTLVLYVRSSATALFVGLKQAQEKLRELTDESDECQRVNAARFFAEKVFGAEQADKLIDFYNDPLAVISVIGIYFEERLAKKITQAQKKK